MNLRHLLAIVVSISMSSCANYQYLTMNSNLTHQSDKGFVFDADSIQIFYQFDGINGPVQIEVRNKTTRPLYLDWSKSAIVVNGEVHPYWKNESSISAVSDGQTVANDARTTYTSQKISGKLTRPPRTDFIPPNSTLKKVPVVLSPDFLIRPGSSQNKRTEGTGAMAIHIHEYDSSNSPLHLRSYLSLSTEPDFGKVSAFDHSFWISSVQRAERPLKQRFADDNRTFHVVMANGAANAAVGIVGCMIIVAAAGQ
jgi:hypothetical protein